VDLVEGAAVLFDHEPNVATPPLDLGVGRTLGAVVLNQVAEQVAEIADLLGVFALARGFV
jgi:hypothetical protein